MGNFDNLPSDITLDILTRLPTESVLGCKLVCKLWRKLVSHHPLFRQLHLTRLNQSADSGELSFLISSAFIRLYYFDYDENRDGKHEDKDDEMFSDDSIRGMRGIIFTPPFTSECCEIVGSVNGLVCLYDRDSAYCICNPVTKEYVMLPCNKKTYCENDDGYLHYSSGFSYIPSTNEYKVLELYKLKRESDFIEVAVYTLGGGHGWRNVGGFDAKSGGDLAFVRDGVFVKGALHWVNKTDGRVFVFDLSEEKFRDHVSPPLLPQGGGFREVTIGELEGGLYYAIRYYHPNFKRWSSFDIWLLEKKNHVPGMKEQVEHEAFGWSKEFNILEREPLAFTKTGGVLCFSHSLGISLGIYDPIASTSDKLLDFSHYYTQIFRHKNTLVSLKEFEEEDVKIIGSADFEEALRRAKMSKELRSMGYPFSI